MINKHNRIKKSSRKLLVATIATIAVAMSADLPETIKPKIGYLAAARSHQSINDSQLRELMNSSTNQAQSEDKKSPHSLLVKKYTVKKGDTLSRIWSKFGGTVEQAKETLTALKNAGGAADVLRIGQSISLFISNRSGEIRGLRRT